MNSSHLARRRLHGAIACWSRLVPTLALTLVAVGAHAMGSGAHSMTPPREAVHPATTTGLSKTCGPATGLAPRGRRAVEAGCTSTPDVATWTGAPRGRLEPRSTVVARPGPAGAADSAVSANSPQPGA